MGDFIYDNLGTILGVCVILVIVLVGFTVIAGNAERDAFMKECLQDKKQYECTAMWRSGN